MTGPGQQDIFESDTVRSLFDEMSASYDRVNRITSFGFANRWRKSCVKLLNLQPGEGVLDLMCGGGECLAIMAPLLYQAHKLSEPDSRITAVDFSEGMLTLARQNRKRLQQEFKTDIQIIQSDVLDEPFAGELKPASFDALVCAYGIKTLQKIQLEALALFIKKSLKPGGRFALVEISVPDFRLLQIPYMFYLKWVIPVLGRILLGNPENYARLGVYTEQFGNCDQMKSIMQRHCKEVQLHSWFWGCATGISGRS